MWAILMVEAAVAQPVDFEAFWGSPILASSIDGVIGGEWNDANYTTVLIDPILASTEAEIWTKHDGTHLYMAARFTADSDNPWLAIAFETTGCSGGFFPADCAVFGDDRLEPNGYIDAYFSSYEVVPADSRQDGMGAMVTEPGIHRVTVELKKPLSSGDVAGHDIDWQLNETYMLTIAWDSDGDGSSGGSVNHHISPSVRKRYLYVVPEFSAFTLVGGLVGISIPLFCIRKLRFFRGHACTTCTERARKRIFEL